MSSPVLKLPNSYLQLIKPPTNILKCLSTIMTPTSTPLRRHIIEFRTILSPFLLSLRNRIPNASGLTSRRHLKIFREAMLPMIIRGSRLQQSVVLGFHWMLGLTSHLGSKVSTLAWPLFPNKCWLQDPACWQRRNKVRPRRKRLGHTKRSSDLKRRETNYASAMSARPTLISTRGFVNYSISRCRRRNPSPIVVSVCVLS